MRETTYRLEPQLLKDLVEAKADLARHGIVIVRAVETELEPAIMTSVRDVMSSSPKLLSSLREEELDEFLGKVRKTAMGSAMELRDLYVRLLSKLGTEFVGDLAKDLEGIGQLFKWSRIQKTTEEVSRLLEKKGFGSVVLAGPGDVSEAFKMELDEKWTAAFERFRALVIQAANEISRQDAQEAAQAPKAKKNPKRG